MDADVDLSDRSAWWKSHSADCETKWTCQEEDCPKQDPQRQYHFTMCFKHVNKNRGKVNSFIKSLDKAMNMKSGTRFFFNQIFSFAAVPLETKVPPRHMAGKVVHDDVVEPSIFMLQNIVTPEKKNLLVFYDSGCSGACLSDYAHARLDTEEVNPGPTRMGVAGGGIVTIPGGEERFWLDLATQGERATFTGLQMPTITTEFPVWNLSEAFNELRKAHRAEHPFQQDVPQPPEVIGGRPVDVMLGIRYLKYFPKPIFSLPCGLTVHRGLFKSPDGCYGVLGGTHKSWRRANDSAQFFSPSIFFTHELRAYRAVCNTLSLTYQDLHHVEEDPEVKDLLTHHETEEVGKAEVVTSESEDEEKSAEAVKKKVACGREEIKSAEAVKKKVACGREEIKSAEAVKKKVACGREDVITANSGCDSHPFRHCLKHRGDVWTVPQGWDLSYHVLSSQKELERFESFDGLGSEITYRCIRCRNCSDCRKGDLLEHGSFEGEVQQALMEKCVELNVKERRLEATLPFILDPRVNLAPNKNRALKVLESQLLKAKKNPGIKEDILAAHNKLLDKGHVSCYKDLDPKEKAAVDEPGAVVNYIPWSVVTKLLSRSTPHRMVFNASSKTKTGHSLNTVLAKGENKLPKILNILLKFGSRKSGFTADVSMAYNSVKLKPCCFNFQRYLWQPELDPQGEVQIMYIKTLIYGVICAGGMTAIAFSLVAAFCRQYHPEHSEGAEAVEAAYVDDAAHPTDTLEDAKRVSVSMDFVLGLASMAVKAYTFAGLAPDEKVSADGESVGLLGYTWWPEADLVSLAVKELFFGKTVRGRLPDPIQGEIRQALGACFTRRTLVAKFASIFDPLGYVTPITAKVKLDLSIVTDLKLGWDAPLPSDLLDTWVDNLQELQDLREVMFKRSFIHPLAVNNQVELLVQVDASATIAVAVVHARTLLPDGSIHCQLVAAKSKLVHLNTVPRAELRAAVLGATLAHLVKRNLGDQYTRTIFVTDSTIVLFWMNQDSRPLQTAVRNSVIEIRRLSNIQDWYHIDSKNNLADIGTREATVADIMPGSEWQTGKWWMTLPLEKMPLMSLGDVQLDQQEKQEANKEIKAADVCGVCLPSLLKDKVGDRYAYSKYIIDPCALPWTKVCRTVAYVFRFVDKLKQKIKLRGARGTLSASSIAAPRFGALPREINLPASMIVPRDLETKEWVPDGFIMSASPFLGPAVPPPMAELRPDAADFLPAPPPPVVDLGVSQALQLSEQEVLNAERYFFLKASKEIKQFVKFSDYKNASIVKDGILHFSGRILEGQEIHDVENIMGDLEPLTFCRPLIDRYSPVAYSVMMHAHTQLTHHRSAVSTLRESRYLAFVLRGRDLANEVREHCTYCQRFRARLVQTEMGKIHASRLTISPPFYMCQVDLLGPLEARCEHKIANTRAHNATVSVYGVVFKCPSSGAIAVYAMPGCTTEAFLQCYTRHTSRYGHPYRLFIDAGSQLIKACTDMEISWTNISATLNSQHGVGIRHIIVNTAEHSAHGVVERSILEVKRLFYVIYQGLKLDLYNYETAFAYISNELNCMPLCLGSKYENLERADLITPSRLLLGRNNKRAPTGYPRIESKSRMIDDMDKVHRAWWEAWKSEKIEDYIPAPSKWHRNTRPPVVGDVVVFIQKEMKLGRSHWKLGRVSRLVPSAADGIVRSVIIEYINHNEEFFRDTKRSVRKMAVLFHEGELTLTQTLNAAAKAADVAMVVQMRKVTAAESHPPSSSSLAELQI